MQMIIKEGVILAGLNIKMRPALLVANNIWAAFGQELTITGGLDGTHSAGSLHYYGLALDFRTRYFSEETKQLVADTLLSQLTAIDHHFQVIVHSTHIHVEYDNV
jgi:hypothetical protein